MKIKSEEKKHEKSGKKETINKKSFKYDLVRKKKHCIDEHQTKSQSYSTKPIKQINSNFLDSKIKITAHFS